MHMNAMTKKALKVNLQVTTTDHPYPAEKELEKWVNATLEATSSTTPDALTIRVVTADAMQHLNHAYRKINRPTNILSFSDEPIPGYPSASLGELVVCPAIMIEEVKKDNLQLEHHWAHIIIHGVLHLLGYDHDNNQHADMMEQIEIHILKNFNVPNPYR
jgi:probable rRNA maturation factor